MYNRSFSNKPGRCPICGGATGHSIAGCVEVLQNTVMHQAGTSHIQGDTIEQLIKALKERGASDTEIQYVLNS